MRRSITGSAANFENLMLLGSADLQGYGNADANQLTGNAGNNLLDGGVGADTMHGGVGNDVYFVDDAGDVATRMSARATTPCSRPPTEAVGERGEPGPARQRRSAGLRQQRGQCALRQRRQQSPRRRRRRRHHARRRRQRRVLRRQCQRHRVRERRTRAPMRSFRRLTSGCRTTWRPWSCRATPTCRATATAMPTSLFGNAGNNILNGEGGADAMVGGAGNDIYFVDNAGDAVFENAGEGTDAVFSTAHFRLTDNVETLVLQGSANLQGYGNCRRQHALRQLRQQSAQRRGRCRRHARRSRQRRLLRRQHRRHACSRPSTTAPMRYFPRSTTR